MTVPVHEIAAMRRAVALSGLGLGTTSPNPPVGCVILDAVGRTAGESYHQRKGESHAEVRALAAAGGRARGGTAVVTLEPCNHYGRTPPCHQALVDAGIARVLIAVMDPTSRGAGGAARLRDAGVHVQVGILADEALVVLRPWLTALDMGRPRVTWVCDHSTGEQVSDEVLAATGLRYEADAVVLADGRVEEGIPGVHGSTAFALPGTVPTTAPGSCLSVLHNSGARAVLLHGGADLAGPFMDHKLVDEIKFYLAAGSASASAAGSLQTVPGWRTRAVRRLSHGILLDMTEAE